MLPTIKVTYTLTKMTDYTYSELAWKQSGLAYTIQDLQNDLNIEKDGKKRGDLQKSLEHYMKEFEEVSLMLENGEYIDDQTEESDNDEYITNAQIKERIEACYDC
jgi:hypothetical protein